MSEPISFEPILSFALPVHNGARTLPRLLASLRAQDLEEIEIVVSDNGSTDETASLVRGLAQRDPRIRMHRTEKNLGQIANFNRALELCRGRYVRWIGADDWLEPSYARRCVEALEAAPHAIAVTTHQDHVEEDGTRHYAEYEGERLDSPRPEARYRRMLWFFTADYRFADPIYATFRRDALLRSRRFLSVPAMDHVLAAELALMGPFLHVPERLAHRGKENVSEAERLRRYLEDPARSEELDPLLRAWATFGAMWESIEAADLRPLARVECAVALARYIARVSGTTLVLRSLHRARMTRRRALSALGHRAPGLRSVPPAEPARDSSSPGPASKKRRAA